MAVLGTGRGNLRRRKTIADEPSRANFCISWAKRSRRVQGDRPPLGPPRLTHHVSADALRSKDTVEKLANGLGAFVRLGA